MGTLWEDIDPNTKRMKVFKGWVVLHYNWVYHDGQPTCESMVFVPDPNHGWELESSDK